MILHLRDNFVGFFFLAEYDAGLHSRDAYLVTLTTFDRHSDHFDAMYVCMYKRFMFAQQLTA